MELGRLLLLLQQIHAAHDAFFDILALGHRRLHIGFVHHGQVVVDVFLLLHHSACAFADDYRQLIAVGWVVAAAIGDGAGQDVAVPILMLQAFAIERGAPGGTTDQEALGSAVTGGPGQIADALEAEHRVEDVERQHWLVVSAVGGGRSYPTGHGAGLVDALFEDLALLVLAVEHHLILVDGFVKLTHRGIDTQLAEHALHAEGACLVRHDGDDARAQFLVLDQLRDDPHKSHGGRDLTITTAIENRLERVQRWYRHLETLDSALGHVAAQFLAARMQVLVFGAAFFGLVEGQLLQVLVVDWNIEAVAEQLEAVDIHLLGVVCGVLALAGTGAVALDGLGQNYTGLARVVHRLVVSRIYLVGVVATAVELPDLFVGEILDHLLKLRASAEEVFAHIGAVIGLVVLVVAVHRFFHALLQQAVVIAGQQRVPHAAPDHLDHIPVRTAEAAFELLNDLAVTAHRAIETLQVAVDHENQVVEFLPTGQGNCAQGFRFVRFSVTDKAPDFLLARLDKAAVLQVLHEARLVDCLNRTQPHGYRGELPEVRHQPGVGIGREALAISLLAEVVELVFGYAPFEEGAGIDAGRGMALEEHQITAVFLGRSLEEVVETDIVQSGAGGKGGDVTAQIRVLLVGTHDHGQRVPAHHRADAPLHEQVARHGRLVGDRNRVAIGRSDRVGQGSAAAAGQFAQARDQVMGAVLPLVVEYGLQRVEPFLGFKRIDIVLLHYMLQTLWA